MEHECCTAEATAIAQAAKNCGGKVIVQVEKVVTDVDPKLVKVPGIYVDAVVVTENKENIHSVSDVNMMVLDWRISCSSWKP